MASSVLLNMQLCPFLISLPVPHTSHHVAEQTTNFIRSITDVITFGKSEKLFDEDVCTKIVPNVSTSDGDVVLNLIIII